MRHASQAIHATVSNALCTNCAVSVVYRYLFLQELWARRKNVTPASSIDFALLEQNLDQGACLNPVKVSQTTQPSWAANVGLTSRSLDSSRPNSFRQSSDLDIV